MSTKKEISDNKIIKALECCYGQCEADCKECPIEDVCGEFDVIENVVGLINRQKAEIERLKKSQTPRLFGQDYRFCNLLGETLVFSKKLKHYNEMIKGLKTEAIKEFVERFENELGEDVFNHYPFVLAALDNLVKEMTEGGEER